MKKLHFHAGKGRPFLSVQADHPAMRNMLAAVLEPYFSVTESMAPLTVLCPEDGLLPSLPRRGRYLVVCDALSNREQVVTMSRPLDLEQFLQTVLTLYSMDQYTGAEDYRCDDRRRTVACGDREVTLTEKEYALFQVLHAHMGDPVAKDELIALLWRGKGSNACQVCAAYLRKKLASIAGTGVLTSVRGEGYILHPPRQRDTEREES